jgi:hypothetical protein
LSSLSKSTQDNFKKVFSQIEKYLSI